MQPISSQISRSKVCNNIYIVFKNRDTLIGRGEGLNANHGCSAHTSFPFFALDANKQISK
jgi:hypothetical protein